MMETYNPPLCIGKTMEEQDPKEQPTVDELDDLASDAEVVAVIGAGSWGTVLSWLLTEQGYRVNLWCYEPDLVMAIRNTRENLGYLPGVLLPRQILATSSIEVALEDANAVVFAVPSHAARSVLIEMKEYLSTPLPILSVSKGIELETLMLVSEIIKDVLPDMLHSQITILSGPSFAHEVRRRQPTHVVLASENAAATSEWQEKLNTHYFRTSPSLDPIGVQLGGAIKNIIAFGNGILEGLEFGENTKAAFLTHGMQEMIQLGEAMGADTKTLVGLAGLGDLVLTGMGALSRNKDVGVRLARGRSLRTILEERMNVAEGINAARAVKELAEKHSVKMPVVQALHTIMYDEEDPKQTILTLLENLTPNPTKNIMT